MQAISKTGLLLVAVERDTKWARDKQTYASPPVGYTLITDRAALTLIDGPEKCGYGSMSGECEEVIASGPGYKRVRLVPQITGQWSNYGAPHGTHTTVKIEWVPVEAAKEQGP